MEIIYGAKTREKNEKEGNLSEGSIFRHLLRISIPAATGLVFNTLYNITDTYFGGKISTEALAGLSLSLPAFFVILAIGTGLGSASTALISNSMGAGDDRQALRYFMQAVFSVLLLSVPLFLLRKRYTASVFLLMGASDELLGFASLYMETLLCGIPFFLLNNVLNSMLNASGNTSSYRNVLVTGFFINIILDPLLLYGFGPFPPLGIAGIALATVLIQGGASVYLFLEVMKSKPLVRFFAEAKKGKYRILKLLAPDFSCIREIFSQGIPAAFNMVSVALGMFIINFFLNRYGGSRVVAAYGIGLRIEQIALLPAFGLTTALLAVTGQNMGAEKHGRVKKGYRIALLSGAAVMGIMLSLILPFSEKLVLNFTSDPDAAGYASYYLKIAGITYYSYIIIFCSNSVLQGIKKPAFILFAGFYRQIAAPAVLFHYICCTAGMGAEAIFSGIAVINWTAAAASLFYTAGKLRSLNAQE